jgi:hypothetical protein
VDRREEQFPLALSVVISLVIIIIIISVMVLSTNQIVPAFVPDSTLQDGWHELIGQRLATSGFLNLDQSVTYTYGILDDTYGILDDSFPATLKVQTKKSIVFSSESQLLEHTISKFLLDLQQNFTLNDQPYFMGKRMLENGHQTQYALYNATLNFSQYQEEIRVIIEIWNCGISKT